MESYVVRARQSYHSLYSHARTQVHRKSKSTSDTTVGLLLRGQFEKCAERGRKRAVAMSQAAMKSLNHLGGETEEKVVSEKAGSDDPDPPLLHRGETSIAAHSEAVTSMASRDSLLVSGGANGTFSLLSHYIVLYRLPTHTQLFMQVP